MLRNHRNSNSHPLLLFILLSLLLHALLPLVAPELLPSKEELPPEPTYVEIQPIEEVRETIRVQKTEEKEVDTQRLGEADQQVVEEQAPEGYDFEDSAPSVAQAEALKTKVPTEPAPPETAQQSEPEPAIEQPADDAFRPKPQPETRPMPDLQQLLQSSTHAAADIARETRVKHRPDVAPGEAVWLNMREDRLFSFFNRFRSGIYGVWNYPQESIERREQGTALLEIIINRDGSVEDVNLLSGSEFERLNREAIAAVFKAAPYGKLPDSYPEEQLRIKAYFHYQLGGAMRIFGR
ncbi:MAG: TonB family protein [Desulfuromonadaceae bacterium]|nr:TonB family protein [Desulfuromonas sp.]MDY0184816.1 TonB family protein [Desulfuromonadaceae bacterium]